MKKKDKIQTNPLLQNFALSQQAGFRVSLGKYATDSWNFQSTDGFQSLSGGNIPKKFPTYYLIFAAFREV